ncbi:hypothetical protein D3C84_552970 [compost metagenome]
MGVQADQHAVAAADVAAEPLDLVGIDVRRGHFHGGRQVEDRLVVRGRLPDVEYRVANLHGEFQFGGGENLRRILEGPLGLWLPGGEVLDDPRRVHRDVHHAGLVLVEDDAAKARRGGVVDVNDGLLGADQRFEGASDQVFAGLGQHLDTGVVGDMAAFDQLADEVKIGLRGRGEAYFDLLDADLHQGLEEAHLLRRIHRLDQRLVAVAQVRAAPDRHLADGLRRPAAVGQIDGREGAVLAGRVFKHAHGVILLAAAAGGWPGKIEVSEAVRFSHAVAGRPGRGWRVGAGEGGGG